MLLYTQLDTLINNLHMFHYFLISYTESQLPLAFAMAGAHSGSRLLFCCWQTSQQSQIDKSYNKSSVIMNHITVVTHNLIKLFSWQQNKDDRKCTTIIKNLMIDEMHNTERRSPLFWLVTLQTKYLLLWPLASSAVTLHDMSAVKKIAPHTTDWSFCVVICSI